MNNLKTTLIGIISIIPMLVVAQHGSTADKQYNWSYSVNYDEDTNIIQLSKQYLDNLGRSTQSMSKNLAANKVMATETVYDQYGRAVISTLPAPIGQDMVIRNNFITNNTGVPYSWQHFDDALLNNPAPVGKDSTNTLGIFYSSNGSEDYVATSSYPYSRVEYMADPTGRVKRGAAPGEQLKMGSGKENQMYYMFTAGELDRAYGVDSSFYCDITLQNPIHSAALSNTEIVAEKTISVDAEGTISISFISDGLTIASCVSGMSPTPSVPEQSALNTLLYAGTRSADIHLPLAKSTTLKLPLPTYRVPFGVSDDGVVDSNEINYTIMDLTTNQLLQINTDYTIGSNRFVTFSGTNKHRFLRISYDYTQTKLNFFTTIGGNPPNAKLEYKLDYSHFSVNYYDFSGKLRTNVSPKGFDYSVNGKHTEYSRYDYNPLGLLITKQMPDEGLTEFLYSDEGVLRFSQNAQQKQEDKFSYFRYDAENRIVEKGEYIENGASTYEFAGYYDEANTGTDVKTINDSVSKLFTTQTHHEHYVAYDLLASVDEIPSAYSYKSNFAQSNLKAKASKTWNENHQTWYSYDYAGRLTFTVQELLDTNFNTDVDETIKTVNYTYAPVTSVILKEEYQKYHATEKITNLYTYNASTQPITVVVKDAANQTIGQADFEYYLNGQLKRKTLGHHLQGMDYVYTLNGALKSMNHPTLETAYDPGSDSPENNGIPEDLFAFAIDYHENDYVRTGSNVSAIVQDGYYNGLIKAVRWKIKDENEIYQASGNIELYNNEDPGMELMYQYTYDKFYRLETANFGVFNGSDFTAEEHYQVYGGSGNSGIDYDMIGNIKTLKRNGFSGDYDLLMDDLEYTYTSGTSQLAEVTDNSTSTYSNDFNTDNGSTFLYNENGQMTAAYPDEVDSILYYPSGLIKQLINSNGDTISYVYNEQGKKIKTIFVDVQNSPNITTTATWYFTDAMGKVHGVYEKINTAAVNLTTEVLYAGGRLAVVSNNLTNYELTDHLGNVRVTFADTSSTSTPDLMVTSWTDYYPFGEVLPGRSSNPEGHLFGYQGQQKAANNSKWYAFQLRMYNPSLGRWNSTDPYEVHYSPYLAMANNPISFVDPDGGMPSWWRRLFGTGKYNKI
ncbi:MAG: RHS repeat-associated core domain-containing protein, partial [Flavobacteriales bacterium]|nr:RHS repeat-associated core domain-containing protein [Flavobacteriales bacterium]